MNPTRQHVGAVLVALLLGIGCNHDGVFGPSNPDRIAFVKTAGDAMHYNMHYKIHVMRGDGSDVRQLTQSPEDELYPAWSPDGSRIAYTRGFDSLGHHAYGIYSMNADGSGRARVFVHENCSDNPCHFIGEPASATWSPTGSHLAFMSSHESLYFEETHTTHELWRVYTINADGSGIRATRPATDTLHDVSPAWSPDGTKIAFERGPSAEGGWHIYLMNPDGTGAVRLTTSPGSEGAPAWSPDGERLALERGGKIYLINANGTGVVQLETGPGGAYEPSWSPDGRQIAFSSDRDGNYDVCVVNVDGTGLTRLTNSPADERTPRWAPR